MSTTVHGPQGGFQSAAYGGQASVGSRERYTVIQKVGEGTYGVVFKCIDNTTGQIVAHKRIRLDTDDEGIPSTAIREVAMLREVNHPNVVRLLDVLCQERKLILVFEFLERDLKAAMDHRGSPLTGSLLKLMAYQLLNGIYACHRRRVVHRDLKPQNILVTNDEQQLKIADFGLARAFRIPTSTYTHEVVTLWYRAPEILLGASHYLPAVDMWSVGCIIAELATNKPLFPGDSEIHQLFTIFRILGTPSEELWEGVTELPEYKPVFPQWLPTPLEDVVPLDPAGIDLLRGLLTYNPGNRLQAFAALQHEWFDEIRDKVKRPSEESSLSHPFDPDEVDLLAVDEV